MAKIVPRPKWALELVREIYQERDIKPPLLIWKTKDRKGSSGWYRHEDRIVSVIAGSDEKDQRHVLLHEIAHHLAQHKKRKPQGHNRHFYKINADLQSEFGDLEYSYDRESNYMKSSKIVFESRIMARREDE